MPIQVILIKNKVSLKFNNRDEQIFKSIKLIAKDHGFSFDEDTKSWVAKFTKWKDIEVLLGDIDEIFYEPDFELKYEDLIKQSSRIKYFDTPFNRRDLLVPPIKGKEPYEFFQLEDIEMAFNTNRYAFFNDPGTGKTYEYMSVAMLQRKYRNAGKILFVTSNSGVYNMKKEFSKFTTIDPSLIAVGGVKNRRPFDDLAKEVIVCNYRSFLLIYNEYHKTKNGTYSKLHNKVLRAIAKWLGDKDGILILDESHNIANSQSQQTDAIDHVKDMFEYIYEGTGTPGDKLEKYYSQLKVLDETLVHCLSMTEWNSKYFEIGTKFNKSAVSEIKPNMIEPLQKIIKSVSSRRISEEVLNLPPHTYKKIYTEFSQEHRSIYEQIVVGALKEIQEEEGGVEARSVERMFPYLVMSVDYPAGLMKHFGEKITDSGLMNKISKFSFAKEHPKVQIVRDLLDDYDGEKFIIWTSHPAVGNELADIFKARKPFIINGETKPPKGMDKDEYKLYITEEFQKDPKRDLAIFSTQVMNSSLNIVKCRYQCVYDSSYNYVEMDQFMKRIYRLGQQKSVTTFVPLIDKSMDIVRRKIMEDKEFLNKYFLTDKYLDKGKLQALFSMEGN